MIFNCHVPYGPSFYNPLSLGRTDTTKRSASTMWYMKKEMNPFPKTKNKNGTKMYRPIDLTYIHAFYVTGSYAIQLSRFWSWSFFLQAGGEVEFQRLGKSVKSRVEYPKSDTDDDDGKDDGADESNGPEEDIWYYRFYKSIWIDNTILFSDTSSLPFVFITTGWLSEKNNRKL